MWQQLGKSRDMNAWEMTPATVNAYYNPPGNEVGFSVFAGAQTY
jgi:endothelin-converting enzyme